LQTGQAGTSNLYASQNDTGSSGYGNFATVYDSFTLSSRSDVEDLHWTGGYFSGSPPPTVTAWTVNFYANAAGAPAACCPRNTSPTTPTKPIWR
jgi:hypothetical protein